MTPRSPRVFHRPSSRPWLLALVGGLGGVWLAFHFPIYTAHGSGTLPYWQRLWSAVASALHVRWSYPGNWFIGHRMLIPAVSIVALLYVGVLWAIWRRSVSLAELCAWTLAAGLLFVVGPRFQSSDISDYLIRARMEFVYHLNPFATPPMFLVGDPFMATAAWPHVRWVYGPLFLLFMAPFARMTHPLAALLFLRATTLLLHVANGCLVWHVSSDHPRRRTLFAAAYLLSPLLIIESAGNAHNDFLMILFILLAVLFSQKGKTVAASASLAAAVLIKLYAAPVLICFCSANLRKSRREAIRAVLPAVVMIIAAYAPFWAGPTTVLSAFDGGSSKRLMHSLLTVVHLTTGLPELRLTQLGLALTLVAVVIGAGASLVSRRWQTAAAYTMFFWCSVGSGWFWPWYAAAPAALALSARHRPIRWGGIALLVSTLALYLDPHLWSNAQGLGSVVLLAVFLIPLGTVALVWWLGEQGFAERLLDDFRIAVRPLERSSPEATRLPSPVGTDPS